MALAKRAFGWLQASQNAKQGITRLGLPVIDGLRLLKALA
jgi:hypothetical protein